MDWKCAERIISDCSITFVIIQIIGLSDESLIRYIKIEDRKKHKRFRSGIFCTDYINPRRNKINVMDYLIFGMYMPFVLSIGAYYFSKNKTD
jgi:hypothetical protein